ncbi:MAG: hypothetical protein JSS82_15535 [Bacteroidetes bacterium]|nr:hypothetical protein [Bacteroidota bacterium]
MANSQFRDVVNRVLQHVGEPTIPDASTFNTDSSLTKIQLQAKLFVDKVNRRLVRKSRGRFLSRVGTFSVTSGSNSYSLPAGVLAEDLKEDTVFVTTTGKGRKLEYIDYDEWLMWFPSGETTKGLPSRWYVYPPDGTGVDKIGFSAPSNVSLTVRYEYYLNVSPITLATDEIAFPVRFEDILWDHATMWVEVSKAEGKASDYAMILDNLFEDLRQEALGSPEHPPKVVLGLGAMGFRKTRSRYARSPGL